jgi:hypothetical protein
MSVAEAAALADWRNIWQAPIVPAVVAVSAV